MAHLWAQGPSQSFLPYVLGRGTRGLVGVRYHAPLQLQLYLISYKTGRTQLASKLLIGAVSSLELIDRLMVISTLVFSIRCNEYTYIMYI
jgi:hypothetical protein